MLVIFSIFSYDISSNIFKPSTSSYHSNQNYIFDWPLEKNFYISSYFGNRIHPISNKKSYHSGIDIPATSNTKIYSISNGTVSYIGLLGANGFSIIVSFESFEIIYGHVSPTYIVKKNDTIHSKQLIGYVGSKFINVETPYIDSNGRYLNGLTTGPHLHLSIKKDGIAVNPLDYL